MGDAIKMRIKEIKKLRVIHKVIEGSITQGVAAQILGITARQVRRLESAVRKEGDTGIIHKSRGRSSNRKIAKEIREAVIELYRGKYRGFGPTLFEEEVEEYEGIKVSKETIRKWLITEGLWGKKRRRRRHRQWRQRRECLGEMIQIDGSHHDWLEGRGETVVVMGYIDDATNRVYGRFYDYEGTIPAMDSFKRYTEAYGLPQSVYVDKHTTYRSNKSLSIEELSGIERPMSQFERALEELGVEVIHAHSPQAKGRIERLFGVFQDRVIKEMRLKGIKTKAEANKFLESYLPRYNKRFMKKAINPTDVHVKLPIEVDLDRYLCIKEERTIRRDNTISYKSKLYQIKDPIRVKRVTVEERIDSTIHITSKGKELSYEVIKQRQETKKTKVKTLKTKTRYVPPSDHPWRRFHYGSNNKNKGSAKY